MNQPMNQPMNQNQPRIVHRYVHISAETIEMMEGSTACGRAPAMPHTITCIWAFDATNLETLDCPNTRADEPNIWEPPWDDDDGDPHGLEQAQATFWTEARLKQAVAEHEERQGQPPRADAYSITLPPEWDTLEITQGDIARGRTRDVRACPLAHAAQRCGLADPAVHTDTHSEFDCDHEYASLSVNLPDGANRHGHRNGIRCIMQLSDRVRTLLNDYDRTGKMAPTLVRLTAADSEPGGWLTGDRGDDQWFEHGRAGQYEPQ